MYEMDLIRFSLFNRPFSMQSEGMIWGYEIDYAGREMVGGDRQFSMVFAPLKMTNKFVVARIKILSPQQFIIERKWFFSRFPLD